MASLKNIKIKIHSVKKTATVTHAMEAVSAVKMRKSQERALGSRAYAAAALSVLERLAGTAEVSRHPLMREPERTYSVSNPHGPIMASSNIKKTFVVVVTSDKGLAGSLNSGVIRKVEQEIVSRGLQKENIVLIAIGRRGGEYFSSRGYDVRMKQVNANDGISESDVREVTDKLLEWDAADEIEKTIIIYQNFISTFEQQPTVRQIIPITRETMREMIAGIRPARGKYAPASAEEAAISMPAAYTIEPEADAVLEALLPKLLNIAIFYALLENKASEHSARMVAMKSATDKAKDMVKDLTRTFNKIRQAAITREVSEITSGIEAMR